MKDRIAAAVEQSGLPSRRFADKLGVTYETVRCWLNGKHEPRPIARFYQIAGLSEVRIGWLVLNEGPMLSSDVEILSAEVITASLRAMLPEERAKVIADAIGSAELG